METVGLLGPKRALLRASFDMAFAGHGESFPAAGEPAYVRLMGELGFEDAVREYVRLLAASIARTAGLWRAFHAAADADAKAAEMFDEIRGIRRTEFVRTATWLADRGVVAHETVPMLVEEFFVIASHETYLLLSAECAYTAEDFAARLTNQVSRLLDPDAAF